MNSEGLLLKGSANMHQALVHQRFSLQSKLGPQSSKPDVGRNFLVQLSGKEFLTALTSVRLNPHPPEALSL